MRSAPFAAALVLLASQPGFPQAATGAIDVALRRETAAGAPVRVRLSAPGIERDAIADDRGRVAFFHLRPGRYRLQAFTAQGPCGAREVALAGGQSLAAELACGSGEGQAPAPRDLTPDRTTRSSAAELRSVPRPADPWSVLRDVPGVVVDRVNVGGSDTAQQSLLVAYGDGGSGAVWTLDGADVTDPAALGFTAVYPDMDALDSFEARTGAFDVRVRTPGVQVRLFLREPGPRVTGGAHVRVAPDALHGDNLPPELASRNFLRNRTDHVLQIGGEAGGPVRKDRLWLWGAANLSSLRQDTLTEHGEGLRTTSFTTKARLRLGGGVLSVLGLRAEKVHEDRDTGFSSAPAARWRQSGPTRLAALEDQRTIGRWSLLSRISYLHAGFRLDPGGGTAADAFEDARGVFQGSYLSFATERPRLQVGAEGASRRRFLGRDHDLVLGSSYRRTRVTTAQGWPGNQVVGLERQSVFFRAFRLTGFAIANRDLSARSVHDQLEAYAQDTFRGGRLTFVLGARLERLSGHNESSSVGANPVFPGLLPAVSYAGDARRFLWLDLLPRAAIAWDVTRDGKRAVRLGYAAYAAPLGAGDVTFDNPLAQQASLTYYWRDRNRDHSVQAGEQDALRGLLGASGLDPDDPAAAVSPNVIDPGLRSPRTHELTASLEESFGPALRAGLGFSFRRLTRALWRPLRGLTLADYVARGSVQGELFGQRYDVTYFAPASISQLVPGYGRILTNREGYGQDAFTVEARAAGRAGARLDWRAWGGWSDWYERFTDTARAVQDPTPLDTDALQDLGRITVRPGGLGRGDVLVNARWTAGATLLGHLPARIEVALNGYARDGFPIPYFQVGNTGDPTGAAKNVLIAPHVDSYRLPVLVLVDARVSRSFAIGRGVLTASLDVFNLLNTSATLQVARDIQLPAFDRPREIVRPRLLRLGVDYRF